MKKHSKTSNGSWLAKSAFVSFVNANVTRPLYKERHVLFLTMIWDQKYLFISKLLQSVIEFGLEIFEFIVRRIKNIFKNIVGIKI